MHLVTFMIQGRARLNAFGIRSVGTDPRALFASKVGLPGLKGSRPEPAGGGRGSAPLAPANAG